MVCWGEYHRCYSGLACRFGKVQWHTTQVINRNSNSVGWQLQAVSGLQATGEADVCRLPVMLGQKECHPTNATTYKGLETVYHHCGKQMLQVGKSLPKNFIASSSSQFNFSDLFLPGSLQCFSSDLFFPLPSLIPSPLYSPHLSASPCLFLHPYPHPVAVLSAVKVSLLVSGHRAFPHWPFSPLHSCFVVVVVLVSASFWTIHMMLWPSL